MKYCKHFNRLELDFEKLDIYNFDLSPLVEAGFYFNRLEYDYLSFYNTNTGDEILIYPELETDFGKGVPKQAKEATNLLITDLIRYREELIPGYKEEVMHAYAYFKGLDKPK